MDAERDRTVSERFSPDTIDAELRRALAVEPSTGFQARFRARVAAEERIPRRLGWKWVLLPAAALGAAAMLMLALRIVSSRPVVAPATAPVFQSANVPEPSANVPEPTAPPHELPREPVTVARAPDRKTGAVDSAAHVRIVPAATRQTTRPTPQQTPEVIFDPREREGFRRLVAALQTGHVDSASLVVDNDPAPKPIAPIADLSVPPLPPVEPLTTGGY